MKTAKTIIFILLLSLLFGCDRIDLGNYSIRNRSEKSVASTTIENKLAEVTTPKIIRKLNPELEQYQPRVEIVVPNAGKTFEKTDVKIKLAVEDLPIFQDDKLNLGNHVNLIVDNEPPQPIYSLEEPIVIKNLAPGTHTVRAFAVRAWGESFKNRGAYAQTTFNVLTETNENRPNLELPLLTYNSPTGTYGAEPLLLDYFIDNSLKSADTESWQVKTTINGHSFVVSEWQPYYLTGFEPGENWVQLELIDSNGKAIENTFNNTVRVFNYDPQQQDTLAKLVTNNVSLEEARSVVEQNYYLQPVGTPEVIDIEELEEMVEPEIVVSDSDTTDIDEDNLDLTVIEKDSEVPNALTPEVQEISGSEPVLNNMERDRAIASQAEIGSKVDAVSPTASTAAEKTQGNKIDKISNSSIPVNAKAIESKIAEDKQIDADTILSRSSEKPAELETNTNKIAVTKSNVPEEKVIEIVIPDPESVEINGSNIAIIPTKETEQKITESEVTNKLLWWKKLLIRVRQSIEALARQLPDEV